jgi:uncharacterized membrane protein
LGSSGPNKSSVAAAQWLEEMNCGDGAGVAVIVIGALAATLAAGLRSRRGEPDLYRRYRQQLGRSVLLGLELLVAADIIRTVAATPTLVTVAVLGGIVLIRTFLGTGDQRLVAMAESWPAFARGIACQPERGAAGGRRASRTR